MHDAIKAQRKVSKDNLFRKAGDAQRQLQSDRRNHDASSGADESDDEGGNRGGMSRQPPATPIGASDVSTYDSDT